MKTTDTHRPARTLPTSRLRPGIGPCAIRFPVHRYGVPLVNYGTEWQPVDRAGAARLVRTLRRIDRR